MPQNQIHFILSAFTFCSKISKSSRQDQQNGKPASVNYLLNTSGLTSGSHPLTFLQSPHLSLEFLLNFVPNLYIPSCLGHIFKFVVFRLLKMNFAFHEIERCHFYSCPPDKTLSHVLKIIPKKEKNYSFPLAPE